MAADGVQPFKGQQNQKESYLFWPVAFIALNLPPHLRVRPGLMLPATIIPGPQVPQLQGGISPSIDEIAYGQQRGFQLRDAAWTPADLPLQQDFLCRLSLGVIGGDYRGVVKIELKPSAPAHKYACFYCEAEGFSICFSKSIFPGALRLLTRSNPMRALLRTINRPMAGPSSAPGPPVPAVSAAAAKELQPPPAATNESRWRMSTRHHFNVKLPPRRPGQKPLTQQHSIDSVLHEKLGAAWKAADSVSNDLMHTRVGVVRNFYRLLLAPVARVGKSATNMEIYSNQR